MSRRIVRVLVGLSLLIALVFAVPSLGQVLHQLGAIDPRWVAAAVLVYPAIAFWIPSLGYAPAKVRAARRSAEATSGGTGAKSSPCPNFWPPPTANAIQSRRADRRAALALDDTTT